MPQTPILILVEHDRGQIKRTSLHAISLAKQLGQAYLLLAVGHQLAGLGDMLASYGAQIVILADDEALLHPLADRFAKVVADVARSFGATSLLASSSTFSKDILPRAAALLDMPMLSDVIGVDSTSGETLFRRPTSAGNVISTVKLDASIRIMTIRPTAFEMPAPSENLSAVERFKIDRAVLPCGAEFVSREMRQSARPDLSEARVVVAGGRPLKDSANFERLIGGLADVLNGAVASTRAAVDTGIAPNDCQVGQTGKIVAPQLYIGIGISGAIQHLAGVKDSRIIVAINKDPEAPIFQAATYGLVDDLNTVVPQMMEQLKNR